MKITRRNFIEGLGVIGIMSLLTPGELMWAFSPTQAPLRPPGAVIEKQFNIKCIRCFKCGQVCPTGAINFGKWHEGQLADTPLLNSLHTNACNLCMECTNVCPTGALTAIKSDPGSILKSVKIGTAHIIEERCVLYNGKRPFCNICRRVCPFTGKAVYSNELGQPVIDKQYCVGCGLCVQACPAMAVYVGRD